MKSRTKSISFTLLLITACASAFTAWLSWEYPKPIPPEELRQANERIETARAMVKSLEVQLDAARSELTVLKKDALMDVETPFAERDCGKDQQHEKLVTSQPVSQESTESPVLLPSEMSRNQARKNLLATLLCIKQIESKENEVVALWTQLYRAALQEAQNVLVELTE